MSPAEQATRRVHGLARAVAEVLFALVQRAMATRAEDDQILEGVGAASSDRKAMMDLEELDVPAASGLATVPSVLQR